MTKPAPKGKKPAKAKPATKEPRFPSFLELLMRLREAKSAMRAEAPKKPKHYGDTIKCLDCGDIIQSKHQHDWVCCTCYKDENSKTGLFVDGGGEYLRFGCKQDSRIKVVKKGKYLHK